MRRLESIASLYLGQEDENEKIDVNTSTPYAAMKFLCSFAENSQLSKSFWNDPNVQTSLATIRKVLPINDKQIVIMSVLGAFTIGAKGGSIPDLGSRLRVSPYEIFEMKNDINSMIERGILECVSDMFRRDIVYKVNEELLSNLRDNKPNVLPAEEEIKNGIDLIRALSDAISRNDGSLAAIEHVTGFIFDEHKEIDFTKRIFSKKFDGFERVLLIILIDVLIRQGRGISFDDLCGIMSGSSDGKFIYQLRSYLFNPDSRLIKMKYVKLGSSPFEDNANIKITDTALSALLPKEKRKIVGMSKSEESQMDTCTIISPKDIFAKELIYDDKTKDQVQMLRDILSDSGLRNLQTNLSRQGLHKGINVLLYGYPGMGKTESVLQLCKETNRNVLQVNISDMKSCWFGKSEKIVSELFDKYERLMKRTRRVPVLLFNEADGVLSRRKSIGDNDTCAQTENAIQNILLQRFEDNEGIIICTTNMTKNLDDAFNRRFLYKVEFSQPDTKTRAALVKLKLGKYLTDEQCASLASSYQVTGGMLDNILTKIVARQCLYNTEATIDDIELFCRQDMIHTGQTNPVGF